MKNLIVQIYEIQTPHELEKIIELGVDHVGGVILSETEWKVPVLRETVNLIAATDAKSSLIPLFSNLDNIFRSLDYYRPDIIHFCEAPSATDDVLEGYKNLINLQEQVKQRFPEISTMRAIPIAQSGMGDRVPSLEIARMFESVSDYFLTDTFIITPESSSEPQPVSGFVGITGKTCDWDVAAKLVKSTAVPVILAGGISPDNVSEGIRLTQPAGVDSCTATNALDAEGHPIRFKKDPDKVKQLIQMVRRF